MDVMKKLNAVLLSAPADRLKKIAYLKKAILKITSNEAFVKEEKTHIEISFIVPTGEKVIWIF